MFPIKGKNFYYSQTALIDEDCMVIGGHLDEATILKIKNGEYIDFSKLVPKDRIIAEEEKRLEMVIKGGHTNYIPVNEGSTISNFYKWEQAFRAIQMST